MPIDKNVDFQKNGIILIDSTDYETYQTDISNLKYNNYKISTITVNCKLSYKQNDSYLKIQPDIEKLCKNLNERKQQCILHCPKYGRYNVTKTGKNTRSLDNNFTITFYRFFRKSGIKTIDFSKISIKVFSNNSLHITGCPTLDTARYYVKYVVYLMKQTGAINADALCYIYDFKLHMLNAYVRLGFGFDLNNIKRIVETKYPNECGINLIKNKFRLDYKFSKDRGVSIMLFEKNGNLMISSKHMEEIHRSVQFIDKLFSNHYDELYKNYQIKLSKDSDEPTQEKRKRVTKKESNKVFTFFGITPQGEKIKPPQPVSKKELLDRLKSKGISKTIIDRILKKNAAIPPALRGIAPEKPKAKAQAKTKPKAKSNVPVK
uniref:Uncharacterized protein n=1 Tax=viral metagenome TaxID=1070528 RepID=A0A6C0CKT0_9ZZZZ